MRRQRFITTGSAFTLLEVLATGVVLALILVITLSVASHTTMITNKGRGDAVAFQEARTAFETLHRVLSEAVLNSYWDYDSPTRPKHYLRASELHFALGEGPRLTAMNNVAGSAIFCQTPSGHSEQFGLKNKGGFLNSVGFYTSFSTSPDVPDLLEETKETTMAWRLWMIIEPSEEMAVYSLYSGSPQKASDFSWFRDSLGVARHHSVLANHVILLLIRAGYTDASGEWIESYTYDSRGAIETTSFPQEPQIHQLPSILHLTLVAIDAETAGALVKKSGGEAYRLMPEGELFSDATKYQQDLKAFQAHLDSKPLGGVPVRYRVFETSVNVANSPWSL